VCADVAAEGEDCGEVYLEDLLQPIESAPLSLENRTRRLKVGDRAMGAYLIPIIIRKLRTRMPPLNPRTIDKNIDLMSVF
jgi:hypothetical protein